MSRDPERLRALQAALETLVDGYASAVLADEAPFDMTFRLTIANGRARLIQHGSAPIALDVPPPGRASVFERADLYRVLGDIQQSVDTYAKDHVSAPDSVQLRVVLVLNGEGAKMASWSLEDVRAGPLV